MLQFAPLHLRNDQPFWNEHTQIMTVHRTYSNRAVQISGGLELAELQLLDTFRVIAQIPRSR